MAKDGRTEKATPKKIKEEREKGNIAKSQDLSTFFSLMALAVVLFFYAESLVTGMAGLVRDVLNMTRDGIGANDILIQGFFSSAKLLVPVLIIGTFFQVANYLLQVTFLFSFKAIKPKWEKVSPKALLNYSKELFSKKKWFDVIKYLFLMIILGYVAYMSLNMRVGELTEALWYPWARSLDTIFNVFRISFLSLIVVIAIIAMVDFAFQRWDYQQRLMMKPEQIKEERKTQEGNPHVKARQRSLMFEFLQQDASRKIPEATFMVNNPTHFSVAIRFKPGEDDVPRVIAKGEDELALYMRSLAKEHGVPMVENKPLARSLYFNVETGDFIDEDMYVVVSTVMKELIKKGELESFNK